MRVYGLSYLATMNLPMKVFWHLSGTVPRLLAGENRDLLEITTVATHNPEGAREMMTQLAALATEPVVLNAKAIIDANSVRDESGFDDLRAMAM